MRSGTTDSPSNPSTVYLAGFDYLRIAAAFAVVWIHGSDTNALATKFKQWVCSPFAVPSFLMVSAFLATESLARHPALSWWGFIQRRAWRLLPAYFFWSAIYLVCIFAKHRFVNKGTFEVDWGSVLLAGGASYQLWYVTTLFYLCVLLFPFLRYAIDHQSSPMVAGSSAVLAILSFLFYPWLCHHLPPSSSPFRFILVSISQCIGFFFAAVVCWRALRSGMGGISTARRWACALLGGTSLLLSLPFRSLGYFDQFFTVGIFLIALAASPVARGRGVAALSALTFGIYLCHGIFVEGFQLLASMAHFDISSFGATTTLILLSFAGSALLSWVLSRTAFLRWTIQ